MGKHTRNAFKNPYRKSKSDDEEDFRLKVSYVYYVPAFIEKIIIYQWLVQDMMGYLKKWEESVTQREGYKDLKNEQNMMLLPLETRQLQVHFVQIIVISLIHTICSEIFCGDCSIPFHHPWCRIVLQQLVVLG